MASPGEGSSGSSGRITSSGSDDDKQQIMDLRQRKRKISNRESARRSRVRKQQHLDGLMTQVSQLTVENAFILTNLNATTQVCLKVEAENSVLRAQVAQLTYRLNWLNEIIGCLNQDNVGLESEMMMMMMMTGNDIWNPWNLLCVNQPVVASTDMLMY